MCPQRTVNGSEDCLFLGLYSRPWTLPQPLRPVLVTFYGGGFIRGGASLSIPPSGFPVLNVSQLNDFLVVYPNYRTNAFGFLPGKKVKAGKDVDLNPGLLDQQAALKWVQQYASAFGGDPGNVTIWGQSAGGGSVVAQTIAKGNRGKSYFHKSLLSSPYWPKTYHYDDHEAEEIYDAFVKGAGCNGRTDEINCLKNADLQKLRDVSLDLADSHQYTTSSYTWAPVIDDEFLAEPLSSIIQSGKTNAEFAFGTYNLHEGENFIPPGLQSASGSGGFNSSNASFDAWLKGFLPRLSDEALDEIRKSYPATGTAEEINYKTTYERAGLVYRDLVLACPAYWVSKTTRKGWVAEYTISPAKHASDTQYWNQVNSVQKSDTLIYEGYAGAMGSFIETGDPNMHKVTNSTNISVPDVQTVSQLVIQKNGLKSSGIEQLKKRCELWLAQGKSIPI